MKLLVVEDDKALAAQLQKILSDQHYQIDVATDGQAGWDLADAFQYDLILLDWMLPRLDGLSFCQQFRAKGDLTPILLMTANETQSNKIRGLDSGADDYLVKPFDFEELLARVRALLRRGKDEVAPLLVWGDVCLDPRSCDVSCYGAPLHLTAKEYSILELFLRHPQRIFNAGMLLDALWDFEDPPSENAVRAHIKSLRRKLREAGVPEMLETLYGLGYRLLPPPSLPTQPPVAMVGAGSVPPAPASQDVSHSAREDGRSNSRFEPSPRAAVQARSLRSQKERAALAEVWTMARQQYLDKLTQLETLVLAQGLTPEVAHADSGSAHLGQRGSDRAVVGQTIFTEARASEPASVEIRRLLHSLKGGLGTFGLARASAIAAQAQALLPSTPADQLPQVLAPQITVLRHILEGAVEPCISLATEPPATAKHYWLITRDDELWRRLAAEAPRKEMSLQQIRPEQVALTVATLPETAPPLGIILDLNTLDLNALESDARASTHAGFVSLLPSDCPLMGLTVGPALPEQVQAAHLGCKRCLPRSASSSQILSVAAELMQGCAPTEATKILVVDDDRNLLQFLYHLLTSWGFQITVLSNPAAFLSTLEATDPDLIILDYEMPEFSGLDLCQVVRSSPQWQELPILFLSAHRDPATLQSVFEAGADDYVSKPVSEPELIQRLRNRLERTRLRRRLADTDRLTGLSDRRKSVQVLNRL